MKRKMNKHLARLCLCMMLVYLLVPVLSMPAYAEKPKDLSLRWNKEYQTATVSASSSSYTEGDPCWVLQDVRISSKATEYRELGGELTYKEYGYVQAHFDIYKTGTVDITSRASQMPNILCPGDTLTINFDFDIQADISNEANEKLAISGQITRYSMLEDFEPQEFWDKKEDLEMLDMIEYWYFVSDRIEGLNYYVEAGIGNASDGEMALFHEGTDIIKDGSYLNTTYPVGQPGELLEVCVYYRYGASLSLVQEKYLYAWEGSTTQNVVVEAGNGPGETGEEIDSGIIKPGSNHDKPSDDSGRKGDDSGRKGGGVIGTVATAGIGATGVAIGAKVIKGMVGKSGGDGGKGKKKKKREEEPGNEPREERKNERKDEDENGKKNYEMRVFKEFGDTIYVGKTVNLSARIVEISASGAERTVPELTNQISISSPNYLQVGGTFPSGQYQSARVTAPEYDGAEPSSALVTFRLMAPGGSFTQHMRFNIKQADPTVVWPDLQSDASGHYLDIIAGDNATYRVRFFFYDVSEDPEKIEFGQYDHYVVTVEPADTMYTYWAVIKNRTAPMDDQRICGFEDRFYNLSDNIGFTATFKDGLKLSSFISIDRYPEGLSVAAKIENGRIPVQAYEKSDYEGGFNSPYISSSLRYSCVRRTESGVEVFRPHDEDLRYGYLQGDNGEKENNVAMKYEYEADASAFHPLKTLLEPSPGATYLMKIDVVWKEDPNNGLTLPLTFNLKPKSHMEEWQEEFVRLRKSIIAFAPDEDLPKNVERLKHLTPYNSSPNELYLMTQAIRNAYIEYWESEYDRAMDLDSRLNWWIDKLGWAKFVGDCAFSYLVYCYASASLSPAAAPYVDAITSAGKDIFASIGGRYIGAWWSGEELYLDGFVKECTEVAKTALDDCIFEMIPDNPKAFFISPSIKKVGLVVAAYMMVNFAMNLAKVRYDMDDPETQAKLDEMSYEERLEETSWSNSVYTALINSFKDMSVRMLSSIVGDRVAKYLKDPKVQKKLGNFVSNTMDSWWKAEKNVRISAFNAQRKLSEPAKKLYENKALRSEILEKMAYGLRDVKSLTNRAKSFNEFKQKMVKEIQGIPEAIVGKDVIGNVKLSNSVKLLPNSPKKAVQGGMIMEKVIGKGAGIVYDLATGQVIDCFGMMADLGNLAKADKAAAEMKEQVEAKRAEMSAKAAADELNAMIEKVTADIENAETPEAVEKAVDLFLKSFGNIDLPEDVADAEEDNEEDYAFDSTPDFKTGTDGDLYVVLKLRKPGTEEGYRIEYNLNKMFADGLENEMFAEFFKLFFGGKLPDFPEKKVSLPAEPPLPSELK